MTSRPWRRSRRKAGWRSTSRSPRTAGQIIQAIQGVGLPNPTDRLNDPLAFAFSLPGDPRLIVQEGYAAKPNVVDANSTQKIIAAIGQRVADDYTLTRVQRHLSDMSNLARALDLVRGRKTVLYFSEGFDSRLIFGSVAHEKSPEQTAADNDAMTSGAAWSIDVDRRYANAPMQRQLGRVRELFLHRNVRVTAVEVDRPGRPAQDRVVVGRGLLRGLLVRDAPRWGGCRALEMGAVLRPATRSRRKMLMSGDRVGCDLPRRDDLLRG